MTVLYWFQSKLFRQICGRDMDHDWYVDAAPNATDNKLFHCRRCDKSDTYHGWHPPKRD